MTGMMEAAGEVATGAAWSRTVEPRAGEDAVHPAHGACLNCGATLVGRYCHECGQSSHVHRTLMSMVHDLAHGVFHFEGKIWRTVPMLVRRPGELTRRYIEGERARYVSPLALFLFTVFLMFAVFNATSSSDLGENLKLNWGHAAANVERSRQETVRQLAAAERGRAAAVAAGREHGAIDRRIAGLTSDLAAMGEVGAQLAGNPAPPASGWAWFKHVGVDRLRENPGLVIYKVQSAAYKFSWALIFLSTPFVALLFLWRRRFGLYDHATFVTYSISFMSLLAIAAQLLHVAGAAALAALLLPVAPPVHLFAQLRGAYGLSIFSALWRTAFLLVFAGFTLLLFVFGVFALEVVH